MRLSSQPNDRSSWIIPFGIYLLVSAAFGAAYLLRSMWAYPDVPYLTQIISVDITEAALNGNYQPLWEFFFTFSGEHKLFAYQVYLYLDARFFDFSTITEMVIWTFSLYLQIVMVGIYLFHRFYIRTLSIQFLVLLLIPALVFTPIICTGRGMETQIQVSTTLLVACFLALKLPVRAIIFFPGILILSGVYVMLFAGGYAAGGAFAFIIGTALCRISGVCSREFFIRIATSTSFFMLWLLAYLMWYIHAGATAPTGESITTVLARDPLFLPKYILAGLAGTVTNVNLVEYYGQNFYTFVYLTGFGIAFLVLALFTVTMMTNRSRRHVVFPALLISYGVGVTISVMIGRHTDPSWILNAWYPFHFRLVAEGLIVLVITTMTLKAWRGRTILTIFCCGLSVAIGYSYVASVRYQWHRNQYERPYFENIRRYVIDTDPSKISPSTALTPVYLDPASTARALEFLRRYHLTPFDNN